MSTSAKAPPIYRWAVVDYRMNRRYEGETNDRIKSCAAAIAQVKALGRQLRGVTGTVYRPSGGGWFLRGAHGGGYTWEEWAAPKR